MNDVEADIKGKSNAQLLDIAKNVKVEYELDDTIDLILLAEKYDIKEINVVNDSGPATDMAM